jgi:hypothetical protein
VWPETHLEQNRRVGYLVKGHPLGSTEYSYDSKYERRAFAGTFLSLRIAHQSPLDPLPQHSAAQARGHNLTSRLQ